MITTAANSIEKFEQNFTDNNSFLSQKIKSEYRSDKNAVLNNFYCLNGNNLMLMGENMSVAGTLSEDETEEVLSFCQFMGVYGLESRQDNLPIPHRNVMNIMQYTGGGAQPCPGIVKNENIYQFSQFSCSNFPGTAFNMVYSYFARKVNRGVSDIYYLEHNGKIVSGALATHFDDDIYLTFVSTAKNFRHSGLAKQIINHIINVNDDKKIILMCEEELMPFYQKLGFEKTGETYLYKLREEHI